jgi:transcriptional regulator with XRE-family HTH domain
MKIKQRSTEAKKYLEKLSLGGLLLSIRKGEEITQTEFAKKLGISKQYLCDVEHERRFVSPKTAGNFAKILGYSPEQFVRLCLQDMMNRDELDLIVSVVKVA